MRSRRRASRDSPRRARLGAIDRGPDVPPGPGGGCRAARPGPRAARAIGSTRTRRPTTTSPGPRDTARRSCGRGRPSRTASRRGILDDETYDWLAVVRGTLASGGSPVVVDEATLLEANEIARDDDRHRRRSDRQRRPGRAARAAPSRPGRDSDETVAVIFTGVRRETAPVADTTDTTVGGPR